MKTAIANITTGFITVEGFEKFSAQHVFDTVARHLLSQKRRSFGHRTEKRYGTVETANVLSCLYNGPEHTSCAAGPFIKEEFRAKADNFSGGASWLSLKSYKQVPDTNAELISRLQSVHDSLGRDKTEAEAVAVWSKQLREVAVQLSLSQDAIDEMLTGS